MDGYALIHEDWQKAGTPLPVSQRITAGAVPDHHISGTAARIFTGAEVPAGADTVVMQEHTRLVEDGVLIDPLPAPGSNIRRRGNDIESGQTVLEPGRRLRAQELGLIASLGISEISCYSPLKVAVMSTGDELVEPGLEAGPSQIYNSNRFTLTGLLEGWGFDVIDLGIIRDDYTVVRTSLLEASEIADVIVTSGGVSVGEEDHVKNVIEELGKLELWKIAVKPGKPFAFGRVGGTPLVGLPGNPVSGFVTILLFGRPFLLASQGVHELTEPRMYQRAAFNQTNGPREAYLRVKSTSEGLELYSTQICGVMSSTTWGDGMVRQPPNQDISAGDMVEFIPYSSLT
jgi:molybdopterin molybdotransferase